MIVKVPDLTRYCTFYSGDSVAKEVVTGLGLRLASAEGVGIMGSEGTRT